MKPALLAVLALSLIACAPRAASPAAAPEPAVQATGQRTQAECEAGKEHWGSPDPPKPGGTFKQANVTATRPMRLDPTAPGSATNTEYPQIYDRLVHPRACYYEDTVMEPALASSWQVSPDGLTWTFRVREGVRWHDKPPVNGRAFTSADVGWTIEHQRREGELKSFWASVEHQEPDAQTVVLRTKEPDADFLGKLGEGNNFMVPHEVREQQGDFKSTAIGTGPYMMREYRPDQISILERNAKWWGSKNGTPFIEAVQVLKLGDYVADVAAMRTGQTDLNGTQGFNKSDADALKQSNPKLRGLDDVSSTVWNLFLNLRKKPFDDVRVRKALALAVDMDEVNIGGDFQGGGIRSGFISATLKDWGWTPEKVREKFKPDPEGAKRLLAEAGFGPGQLKMHLETGKAYVQGAEVLQKQLEPVGIAVKLVPDAGSRSSINIMRDPGFEPGWGAYTGSSFFPDYWLSNVLHSKGSINSTGLSDPQLDALIDAQRREMDPVKRKEIIDRIQDRLYDTMPSVPGLAKVYYRFYSCRLQNMRPTQSNRDLEGVAEAWLDPSQC